MRRRSETPLTPQPGQWSPGPRCPPPPPAARRWHQHPVPTGRHGYYPPPFSLGFGFQGGFGLVHTTFVVVLGGSRTFPDISGSAVNSHGPEPPRGPRTRRCWSTLSRTTRRPASLALAVRVILTPPCTFHSRFGVQNIQGGSRITLTSTPRRVLSRFPRFRSGAPRPAHTHPTTSVHWPDPPVRPVRICRRRATRALGAAPAEA